MRAQKYLERIRKIDALIENKKVELAQWEDIALSVTAMWGGERVVSSSDNQKMANAATCHADLAAELTALAVEKQEIIRTIEQLGATEYDLLHKVYVQYMELEAVAESKGKSVSWARSIHGSALKNVQRILDRRGEN